MTQRLKEQLSKQENLESFEDLMAILDKFKALLGEGNTLHFILTVAD